MGQINPRALYILAFVFSLLSEVCFITVLSVLTNSAPDTNSTFCWSWEIGTARADHDHSCPFLVFLLAALVNGCLLIFTGIYFALRLCLVAEYFQNPVCLKYVMKYGHFVLSLLTTLLSLVFLGLMIGYSNNGNKYKAEEYTGGLFVDKYYRPILLCVGVILSLLSTVFSAIMCFKGSSPESDYYTTTGGVFNNFTDYADRYEQIN